MKIKDIFKSYAFHNIVAHPIMQLLITFDQKRLGNKIHDATLPEEDIDKNSANSENDHPELFRTKCVNPDKETDA